MRIAVLGDIGQRADHVGDEAMTWAVAHEAAARGHDVLYLTRDAALTREARGPVATARSLEFPWPPHDRVRYLTEIRAVLAGRRDALPSHDQIFAFIEAIRGVDALVIAGGGNMSSWYGWLLAERIAALEVAAALGRPAVVTGQTIGPALTHHDRDDLAHALRAVDLVAAREDASARLLRTLTDPAHVVSVLDDASFLAHVPLPAGHRPAVPVSPGAIVATISPDALGPESVWLPAIAAMLDALAQRADRPVQLVPHMGVAGQDDGDQRSHRLLAAAMTAPVEALPLEHPLVAAQRARAAGLVLTSRYHPVVFAAEGSVPTVAIAASGFTRTRVVGALARWGMPADLVIDPWRESPAAWIERAEAVWRERETIAEHLRSTAPTLREHAAGFWDAVFARLQGAPTPLVDVPPVPALALPAPTGAEPIGAQPGSGEHTPCVSVVMRTRDRDRMLIRALDDVAQQHFRDLELIVVNDGGDPGPVDSAVAAAVGLDDIAIRVLHRARSTGMEAASNAGIAAARGEFAVIHDDDDTWDPTFLAHAVARLRAEPALAAVTGRTDIVYESWPQSAPVAVVEGRRPFYQHLAEVTVSDLLASNHMVPISLVYRRALHEQIGPFDEELAAVGDWEFHLRLTRLGPVPVIGGQTLAEWRQRPTADGTESNSVLGHQDAHARFDRRVRERRLRAYLDEHGDGALLHLTAIMSERNTRLEEKADHLATRVESLQASVDALVQRRSLAERVLRRVAREMRSRLPRSRSGE
ncbi:polysaccharide pyruvyl transferase family protein [Serinibacter salmoneus]|uniref:Glycosyltransferase involved in cell wall biosynthesis n=1 Tax=Serinibacter salmoneus TaxID=556530 RepID=A0A2A9D1V1_9MICO|nr:polysaccharide pyruvyl transferase family protein [Serinibacter salmoneus]PFG20351.1 glycosyltransferase involved in cell wall biosynthesis [Serinibacter salmoneus]